MVAHKSKFNFVNGIVKLVTIAPIALNILGNFAGMVGEEAQIARRSFVPVIILGLIAGSLVTTIWLCLFAMLFLYLVSLQISWMASLLIILFINILLLIITASLLLRAKDKLFFPETQQFFRNIMGHH